MKSLQSIQDVTSYRVEDGRLYSANHDDSAGLTTDVYLSKQDRFLRPKVIKIQR